MERSTVQREYILKEVSSRADHPGAFDIYKSVKVSLPNISLATVYRNLNRLAKEGRVTKITLPDEPERYDHVSESHFHLLCECCGLLFDIPESGGLFLIIDEWIAKSKRKFFFTGGVFRGVCPDCAGKSKNCFTPAAPDDNLKSNKEN
ncbi:MAG: transcriptional repressor [Eubacteriales bacterium]